MVADFFLTAGSTIGYNSGGAFCKATKKRKEKQRDPGRTIPTNPRPDEKTHEPRYIM